MTLPRPVLPGADLLVTRRTQDRRRLLSPHPVINQVVRYALAYAAERSGLLLYAHVCLSNHHHTGAGDPLGQHPVFTREFHSLVARAVNVVRHRSEALWSPDRQNTVILFDRESLMDHIAYLMANPSLSHLVERPEDWPGVISKLEDLAGPPRLIRKPRVFFDPEGQLPDYVKLQFVKPAMLSDWSDEEYREEIARRVQEKCEAARRERQRNRRPALGRTKILTQDPKETPKTPSPKGGLRPLLSCGQKALLQALIAWLKEFRAIHRIARLAFESGDRNASFPYGTYFHRRRYGVDCSAIGPPEGMGSS